jgi:hypothetical protein
METESDWEDEPYPLDIEYFDSLPEDIEVIDVCGKGLTNLDVSRFKKLKILFCSDNRLTSLQLNENLQHLYCGNNRLCSLHLNENLQHLYCANNRLTSLQLNENLKKISCVNNKFTSLHLNEKLEFLDCTFNKLTSLHLNANLQELYCSYNQLTSLQLNANLQVLCSSYNLLTSLQLNDNLQRIGYNHTPIYEIIKSDEIDIINRKIRVLNQFRYLYYCLKFKKRFMNLLWVKIREPKIREKYHYRYLLENLHEDADLDEVLDAW